MSATITETVPLTVETLTSLISEKEWEKKAEKKRLYGTEEEEEKEEEEEIETVFQEPKKKKPKVVLTAIKTTKRDDLLKAVQKVMSLDIPEEEIEAKLIKLIGPPPYTYEEIQFYNLPKKFFTRRRKNLQPLPYAAKNPYPNYYKFVPQMFDSEGREYSIQPMEMRNMVFPEDEKDPRLNLENIENLPSKTKIAVDYLFVRIPKRVRTKTNFPELYSSIKIFDIHMRFQLKCSISACFMRPQRATGYIKVENIIVFKDQDIEQEKFKSLIKS